MARNVNDITADEVLEALQEGGHYGKANAVFQITLFTRLGGDPNDHDYARLSFKTRELRNRGVAIGSSRQHGIWLEV